FEMGEFEVQVLFPEKAPAALPPADKKSLLSIFGEEGDAGEAATVPPPEARMLEEPTYVGVEPTYIGPAAKPPAAAPSSAHEAMQFLLDPGERTEGFLDPLRSIGEACEDLRAHELALMAGMRASVLGALRRLDPQVLEKTFEKSAGGFALGGRKARFWEAF